MRRNLFIVYILFSYALEFRLEWRDTKFVRKKGIIDINVMFIFSEFPIALDYLLQFTRFKCAEENI